LANTDAPEICRALKFDYTGRPRVDHKRLDLLEDAPCDLSIKVL
jgi:hypothetical protein